MQPENPTAADDEGGLYSEWLNGEIEKPDLYDPADARLWERMDSYAEVARCAAARRARSAPPSYGPEEEFQIRSYSKRLRAVGGLTGLQQDVTRK
jgi:hypothetical protein